MQGKSRSTHVETEGLRTAMLTYTSLAADTEVEVGQHTHVHSVFRFIYVHICGDVALLMHSLLKHQRL